MRDVPPIQPWEIRLPLDWVEHQRALRILWAWFFVPAFGLPALGVAQSIGVSIVVGYLTHQRTGKADDGENELSGAAREIGYAFFKPLFALLLGLIVKQFM